MKRELLNPDIVKKSGNFINLPVIAKQLENA